MTTFPKTGLDALLTPDNCVLVLIDHQPFQLANVNSHEPTMVINNVTGLAKTAKVFGIPTILTTVIGKRVAARSSKVSRTSFRTRRRSTAPSSTHGKTSALSKR